MIAYTTATAIFWLVLPLIILVVRYVRHRVRIARDPLLRAYDRSRRARGYRDW